MSQPAISPALAAQQRLENPELQLQALQKAQAALSPEQARHNASQLLHYLGQPSSGPSSDKAELHQHLMPLQAVLSQQPE